jgi:Fe-S cluster assembly protein SufD
MFYTLQTLLDESVNFTYLPSKKDEKWRFSPLHSYLSREYKEVSSQKKEPAFIPKDEFWLYIKDGQVLKHSLPLSVHIKEHILMHEAKDNPFSCLASSSTSLELHLHEDLSLHIYFDYSEKSFIQSSINLIIKENIEASISMSFIKGESSFISHANHVKLLKGAQLELKLFQELDLSAVMICENGLFLEESSSLKSFSLLKGAEYCHNFIHANLSFKSTFKSTSLLLSKENQKEMFSCDINHLADQSKSKVFSKQVLKDSSICLFDANTKIEKKTKGCKAEQASHALLLDEKAHIYSLPHLEIYTDDLSASHGSTVGELDKNAVAYLLSRGINKTKVKQMLISAFIKETLEELDEETRLSVLKKIGEDHE